jgi:uncharacterized protein (DUF983 family)
MCGGHGELSFPYPDLCSSVFICGFSLSMARVLPFKRMPWRDRLAAVMAGRCPRCNAGRIFRGRLSMHPTCPTCGLRFEREPGYFTGAMYVSYALALPVMATCAGVVYLVAPSLSFEATIGVAALLFLPFVPLLFRASRIIWIHLDQTIDPS